MARFDFNVSPGRSDTVSISGTTPFGSRSYQTPLVSSFTAPSCTASRQFATLVRFVISSAYAL